MTDNIANYKNRKNNRTNNTKIKFQKNYFFSLIKKILFGTLQIENVEKMSSKNNY
jgi:hypothetical protein